MRRSTLKRPVRNLNLSSVHTARSQLVRVIRGVVGHKAAIFVFVLTTACQLDKDEGPSWVTANAAHFSHSEGRKKVIQGLYWGGEKPFMYKFSLELLMSH